MLLYELVYEFMSWNTKASVHLKRDDGATILINNLCSQDESPALLVYSIIPDRTIEVYECSTPWEIEGQLLRWGIDPWEKGWSFETEKLKSEYKDLKSKALDLRSLYKHLDDVNEKEEDQEVSAAHTTMTVDEFSKKYQVDPLDVIRWVILEGVFDLAINKDFKLCPALINRIVHNRSLKEGQRD